MTCSLFLQRTVLLALLLAISPMAAWLDDFVDLDTNRWLIQLYTFPANGCNMRAANVEVHDSILDIHVTEATDRKWDGGDMGDLQYRTYGLFRTRAKPSALKGSVSAFYIMNKWVATNWEHKEIDIEFLGKNPTKKPTAPGPFRQAYARLVVTPSPPSAARTTFAADASHQLIPTCQRAAASASNAPKIRSVAAFPW